MRKKVFLISEELITTTPTDSSDTDDMNYLKRSSCVMSILSA